MDARAIGYKAVTFSLVLPTSASYPCFPILQEYLSLRGAAPKLPKYQYSWGSGQLAHLAKGVIVVIIGLLWSPGMLE